VSAYVLWDHAEHDVTEDEGWQGHTPRLPSMVSRMMSAWPGVPSGPRSCACLGPVTVVTGVVAQPLPATPPSVDGVRVGTARAVPTGHWPRYCRSSVARHLAATATEHEE
jgi:hypothetical protein